MKSGTDATAYRSAAAAPTGCARRAAQVLVHGTVLRLHRARCRWLVARSRARARWRRATIDIDIAADVRLGRRLQVTAAPGSRNLLRIGPGCIVGDDVTIELGGGQVLMGEHVDLRARCTLVVSGTLRFEGRNLLQRGCGIHCDEAVTIGDQATLSDYSTVVDSTHTFDGPHAWFVHNLTTAPVVIGADAWLGAKATVTKGVHVGPGAVVGANSVVVKNVPAGYLASGVPARNLRPFTRTAGAAVDDTGAPVADDGAAQRRSSSS